MSSRHDISVTVEPPFELSVDSAQLARLAARVLEAEEMGETELGIVVTDDDTIRRLNRRYADEDEATDVLSFSLREGEEFVAVDTVVRLGEVIISYPTAERQAQEAGRSVAEELSHLLVHGVLHLLGYDHAEPEEERRMQERERELLRG